VSARRIDRSADGQSAADRQPHEQGATGRQPDEQGAAGRRPVLVLGPSLGTSAATLWGEAGEALAEEFDVVTWDLPGHGGTQPATAGYTVAELAEAVLAAVDGLAGGTFAYAGDSIGGAVGLQLLLDHPDRVSAATLLCTGAAIGTPQGWAERAALVREQGVDAVVDGSRARWFGPGFADRHPATASALIDALRAVDAESYAIACEALGDFDVRHRLAAVAAPVLAVAGAQDEPTPVESLREIAAGVAHGRLVVLDGVAHLAPAETPARVACLVGAHSRRAAPADAGADSRADLHTSGMRMRRAVLGDEHVDRAVAATTELTREFQDFITRYAWGEIWNRPGLDRRSRSMITLTALVAGGHQDELALHLRGARNNGLTDEEVTEVLLQTAIYCGVPNANSAFRIAQRVLGKESGA
jgi:3-oxoadipate enol-lactonase/4-carboxymuconolactone decarboxylase